LLDCKIQGIDTEKPISIIQRKKEGKKMITKEKIVEIASDYLEGHEFMVSRSGGGWPTPCGWSVSIIDDIPGSVHTIFIHDDNDADHASSKMISFASAALDN